MQAALTPRQPAPALACGALWPGPDEEPASLSWKGVALGAIGGGVAGGLGGAGVLPETSNAFLKGAMRGAVSSIAGQGIAVATGLQSSFSWRSVAASAIGGGMAQGINAVTDYNPRVDGFDFGRSLVSGFGGAVTAAAVRGGKVSATQVATDAFGNILGDSLVAANGQGGSSVPSPVSENERQAIMGWFDQGQPPAWNSGLLPGLYDRTYGSGSQQVADRAGSSGYGFSDAEIASMREANLERAQALARSAESDGAAASARSWVDANNRYNADIGLSLDSGDRWYPEGVGGTLVGERMTAAEVAAFDAQNGRPGEAIKNLPPTFWERTWLSPEVQGALDRGVVGKAVVGGLMNMAGSMAASVRSDRYNFATGKYLNPVEQRNARIDNFVNLATLPIGMGGVGAARLEMAGGRAVWVQSTEIRQSQQSISFAKRDAQGNIKYTLDDIARGLRDNPTDPRLTIDTVRMPDGRLTTLDNSRPAVLNVQGGGEIRARVREFDEPLTGMSIERFTVKRSGMERIPVTWGEAAELRIWKQGDQFFSQYPDGASAIPRINGAPMGSIWEQYNQYPWQR